MSVDVAGQRIVVREVRQKCDVCPSQWEGLTADGSVVYARYRWGHLRIGIGPSLTQAVGVLAEGAELVSLQVGDSLDGDMTYLELVRLTRDCIDWPLDGG